MATQATQRWLYGPWRDLFLGCGLIYCVAFVALAVAGPEVRSFLPMHLTPLVLLVTGIPHYGATLLRVYQRPEDRRRYTFFSVYATAAVWAVFVVGVYEFTVGSLMLTLYLTWSPWHYTAQNYGIAMMFLRRRGVEVTTLSQRCLKWSFYLSFGLTLLAFHGSDPDVAYAPGEYLRSAYQIIPLGIPHDVVQILVPLLLGAYLGTLGCAAVLLRRSSPWRELVPTLVMAASQALWFTIPMVTREWGVLQGVEPLGTQYATYAFLWIAVAHSVQYVWITAYYAQRTASPPPYRRYMPQILLAGAGIWVVPSLLFAPGVLGNVPYDAGLGALVAAAVNIHHFVLDGAIWKLRDGRIAQILLRGKPESEPAGRRSPIAGWLLTAVGIASTAVLLWSPLEESHGTQASRHGDLGGVETAQQRLRWMGRESALTRITTALAYQARGDITAAQEHVDAALQLHLDYGSLANLGQYYANAQRWDEALDATRRAHDLQPESTKICDQLAQLLMFHRRNDPASRTEAITLAEQAAANTYHEDPRYLSTLSEAYAVGGRLEDALRAAETGLALTEEGSVRYAWFAQQVSKLNAALRGR